MTALGIAGGEAAVGEQAAAAATAEVGAAAGLAGGAVAGVLGAALVAGVALWADWKARVDAAHESLQGISDSQFGAWLNQTIGGPQDRIDQR